MQHDSSKSTRPLQPLLEDSCPLNLVFQKLDLKDQEFSLVLEVSLDLSAGSEPEKFVVIAQALLLLVVIVIVGGKCCMGTDNTWVLRKLVLILGRL